MYYIYSKVLNNIWVKGTGTLHPSSRMASEIALTIPNGKFLLLGNYLVRKVAEETAEDEIELEIYICEF
jgi:hypothetical protein